jgi:hypothetical protein
MFSTNAGCHIERIQYAIELSRGYPLSLYVLVFDAGFFYGRSHPECPVEG